MEFFLLKFKSLQEMVRSIPELCHEKRKCQAPQKILRLNPKEKIRINKNLLKKRIFHETGLKSKAEIMKYPKNIAVRQIRF